MFAIPTIPPHKNYKPREVDVILGLLPHNPKTQRRNRQN
jgi:hypothetical protein